MCVKDRYTSGKRRYIDAKGENRNRERQRISRMRESDRKMYNQTD